MAGFDANKLSVVFMSPHWQCDGYGIATVTRSLINDLWNTDPEGLGLKLACMVIDEDTKISQKDREDAEKYNVKMVGAKLPYGVRGTVIADISWLNIYARAHYSDFLDNQNIDVVIGHIPYLADGPRNIKDMCSRQGTIPQIGLVIHSFPQTEGGDIDDTLLLEWMKGADFVLSVGEGVHAEVETYLTDLEEESRPLHEMYIPGCSLELFKIARKSRVV